MLSSTAYLLDCILLYIVTLPAMESVTGVVRSVDFKHYTRMIRLNNGDQRLCHTNNPIGNNVVNKRARGLA